MDDHRNPIEPFEPGYDAEPEEGGERRRDVLALFKELETYPEEEATWLVPGWVSKCPWRQADRFSFPKRQRRSTHGKRIALYNRPL